jgi:hypothetical protein
MLYNESRKRLAVSEPDDQLEDESVYQWIVFLHVTGVFGFLLAHGQSLAVALRLRRERDPWAVRTLLALSSATRGLMFGSLALLVAAGTVAGLMGGWWGEGWIWGALVLLLAITSAVLAYGTPHYRRLRAAVEATIAKNGSSSALPGSITTGESAELRELLASPRPLIVSVAGALGLVAILWLMLFKPF